MFYTSCTHSPKLILYRNFCLSNIPGVGFPYEVLCQCSENFSTGFDAQHLKQTSKQTQMFLEDFRFYLQKSFFFLMPEDSCYLSRGAVIYLVVPP